MKNIRFLEKIEKHNYKVDKNHKSSVQNIFLYISPFHNNNYLKSNISISFEKLFHLSNLKIGTYKRICLYLCLIIYFKKDHINSKECYLLEI